MEVYIVCEGHRHEGLSIANVIEDKQFAIGIANKMAELFNRGKLPDHKMQLDEGRDEELDKNVILKWSNDVESIEIHEFELL